MWILARWSDVKIGRRFRLSEDGRDFEKVSRTFAEAKDDREPIAVGQTSDVWIFQKETKPKVQKGLF